MTPGRPVVYVEDGQWTVAVLVDGRLQQYRCPTEEKARSFAALFSKPPKVERVRVRSRPRIHLPQLFVRALAWG